MGSNFFFTNEQLAAAWKLIYDEHSFPFDVRFHLEEFLESIPWDDVKKLEPQMHKEIYDKIMQELNNKIADNSLDRLKKLHLRTDKAKLEEQFATQPTELVDVLQNCFKREQLLRESTKADEDRQATEEDVELLKYRQKETEIKGSISVIKTLSKKLEVNLATFHTYMQNAVSVINDKQDKWNTICQNAKENNTESSPALTQEYNVFSQEIRRIADEITAQKKSLSNDIHHGSKLVFQVLEETWQLIKYYKRQQKQSVCYLGKPPEGAIETLNKVCEESSRQLKVYIFFVEKLLADVNLVNSGTEDKNKEFLEQIKKELFVLLQKHLDEIFVITKQPQNVQKIVQNKSPTLSMCVRLLGGMGLGIEHSLPSVTVRVYAEPKLRAAMQANEPTNDGLCKSVENGKDVMMELKRSSGHIQANLNSVQLRGVERLEKKVKDDRVTEHKYGMVFYTKVNVCNRMYSIKTLSNPIVLTSQTSQNGAAKGTLIWNAAFSKEEGLYEDEPSVLWPKMEEVLRAMFKETGRDLGQDQLNYIASYIFNNGVQNQPGVEEVYSTCQLTKERFLRDKVPNRDFTFWRWIYACKNLVTDHVSKEWKDGIIYGFIGRVEAERLLRNHEPGTFLLRFRERKLEDSQRASKCACLALAVVGRDLRTREQKVDHVKDHLTPTDIHKYTLTRILNSLVDVETKQPLLRTLYPDRNFQALVKEYLPDTGEASAGYNSTLLLIGVKMNNGTDGTSDNPLSPDTMPPPTPPSDFSSDMLSDDLQNIHVDPFPDQPPLESFLTVNGNMLMISGNNMDDLPGSLIPKTVTELDEDPSPESSPILLRKSKTSRSRLISEN